jgi:hypothetical protein
VNPLNDERRQGQPDSAQPGDVANLRKEIPHAWGNRTNADLRIAVFARPGVIEEVLRQDWRD